MRQGDLLFVLYDQWPAHTGVVSSVVRGNGLVIHSTVTQRTSHFLNAHNEAQVAAWRTRWEAEVSNYSRVGAFDFVILLGTRSPILTVIELRRLRQTAYLLLRTVDASEFRLRTGDATAAFGLELKVHPEVVEKLNANAAQVISAVDDDFKRSPTLHINLNWFPWTAPQR